jgi:ABC-type glycerol-3-phosphate transport system substrate-binding protein
MISKIASLKVGLQAAIQQFKPYQAFNVVFYTDGGKVLAADKGGLMVATAENNRKAFGWMEEVTASGTTDPIPAMRLRSSSTPRPTWSTS